ncbi:hypothetical protein CR513_22500, partial [Mucuna pruriens]
MLILEEEHMSSLSMQLSITKMFQDIKKMLWWPKKKVTKFVYVTERRGFEHRNLNRSIQNVAISTKITEIDSSYGAGHGSQQDHHKLRA